MRLMQNTTDVQKQRHLRELGELVQKLRSTSANGKIISNRHERNTRKLFPTDSFITVITGDGPTGDTITDDVNEKIDCLLGLYKLKETRKYAAANQEDFDSDDEQIVSLSEVSQICALYFESFGVQLIAASSAGNLSWMKALLRVGADPNEAVLSDKKHKPLTAFHGCLAYAPEEMRIAAMKLLMANGCKARGCDITKMYTPKQLFMNGMFDILIWLGISDNDLKFDTDLQKAARHCDHGRMEVSNIICKWLIVSGLEINVATKFMIYMANSCMRVVFDSAKRYISYA